MSIRLRLTLLYSAILALTLIGSGIGLYVAVSRFTVDSARAALDTETNSVSMATQLRLDPDQGILRLNLPTAAVASQDLIQLRGSDGTVIYQSASLKDLSYTLPLDASTRQQLQPGHPIGTILSFGGKRVLVDAIPILAPLPASPDGSPVGILQIGSSLQGVDQTLKTLRQILLFGGGIVTLLACGAGWALAGAALRPINRITQTAREIGAAQDFGRRVDYAGPSDEVGRLASTFNAMLERLQAAYHAQRRFVGDASHELRTPLTTIRGNVDLLQREPPIAEADRIAIISDLAYESERLSRLVSDLLTLARRDAGRPLRLEIVPLGPLVSDLLRRLAVTYPGRSVNREGRLEATVVGDPDALTQVLLILLDNALKFTPAEGSVTVVMSGDADYVSVQVRDTGPGMAPEVLTHIFERFYQGDSARAQAGTGLGLSIAKALIEAQRGTISVRSEVGRGSVFTVTLPRAAASQAPERVRAGAAQ